MDACGYIEPVDITDYLTELHVIGRAANTIRIRRAQLRTWLAWLIAHGLTPATASRADVVRFLARYPEPETRSAYRAALRGFHAWLLDTGRATADPAARIPAVACPDGDPHPIPDPVLAEVLGVVSPRHASMLLLGRFAGLRAAEIAAAHRDYLLDTPGGPVIRLRGKGGRLRELPAHPQVVPLLADAPGLLFGSRGCPDTPIRASSVSTLLARLLPAPWTGHSLRHAFATEAYNATRDLLLVQRWMGHSRPTTTVRYIRTEHDHQAMARLRLAA